MAKLLSQTIEAPEAGLDTESAEAMLSAGFAPEHTNFLPHFRGKAVMRGPIAPHTPLAVAHRPIAGVMRLNNKVLLGFVNMVQGDPDHFLEPWVAPYRASTDTSHLARAQAAMSLVDLAGNTIAPLTASGVAATVYGSETSEALTTYPTVPGGYSAQIGNNCYVYAYEGSAVAYQIPSTVVVPDLGSQSVTTAASTVEYAAAAISADGEPPAWVSATNAKTNDASYATYPDRTKDSTSATLILQDYGFAIPADAVITGIAATVKLNAWVSHTYGDVYTGFLSLRDAAGAFVGTGKVDGTAWPITSSDGGVTTTRVYGSSSDMWGVALTPTMVNDPDFGLSIALNYTVSNGATIESGIDYMSLTVYYTTSTTVVADSTPAKAAASRSTQWARPLLSWNGLDHEPVALTYAPTGGQDVKAHLNRLFVLGGKDVPSIQAAAPNPLPSWWDQIEPNTLFWSVSDGPVKNTAAEWRDPVSNVTNKITIDTDNEDFGVGLATVGQNLAIFKRNSVHALYGYSNDTFTIKTISASIGCVDRRSIVEVDDGVYFLSRAGYYFFDGSKLTNVSLGLASELAQITDDTVGLNGQSFGRATATRLPNNYILLSICNLTYDGTDLVQSVETFAALLHTPSGRWSRFTSDATSADVPFAVFRSSDYSVLFDGVNIVHVNPVTTPETQLDEHRGLDTIGTTIKRIPSRWRSRLMELAGATQKTHLERVFFNYVFKQPGDDSQHSGWYVKVYRGDGTVAVAEFRVPNQGNLGGSYFDRRQKTVEAMPELQDATVVVEWRDDPDEDILPVIEAEIHTVTLQFSSAQPKGNA